MNQEYIRSIFNYKNGNLYWKKRHKGVSRKDLLAGCLRNTGYIAININGKLHQAHKLIWLYHYNEYIEDGLDHINRIRDDNRIENLRKATKSENAINKSTQSNNKSGHSGVFFRKDTGKWTAYIGKGRITKGGKTIKSGRKYLGCFDLYEDALSVRIKAEKEIHGEFSANEN